MFGGDGSVRKVLAMHDEDLNLIPRTQKNAIHGEHLFVLKSKLDFFISGATIAICKAIYLM